MTDLYSSFKIFYDEDEPLEDVLEQWQDMKMEIISSHGLINLSFHDLWARMLVRRFSTTPHSLVVSSVSWCMMGRLPCEMSVCASACARGARLRRGWLRWVSARKARMGV